MHDASIGADDGAFLLRDGELEPLGLARERVSAIHAWQQDGRTAVLAGSYGGGLFRSADGGAGWSRVEARLTASVFRCIAPDPTRAGAIFAGTEPARIFRGDDGGETWRELDGITRIAGHERWFLPYSPRAGAVRNVYGPGGARLLASVEVGGMLTSEDAGERWTCGPVIADEDVHLITGHPEARALLYAALGTAAVTKRPAAAPLGGVARSRDGGASWEKLETDYTRAVLVPSARPDLLVAGPAPRVGRGGRIVVSADGGDSWEPAGDGIEVPMPDMVELFVAAPDRSVWAICAAGRLLRAEPGEWSWSSALPARAAIHVRSVAFA